VPGYWQNGEETCREPLMCYFLAAGIAGTVSDTGPMMLRLQRVNYSG
jgi:hypothetical protein